MASFQLNPYTDGPSMPDEPCITCTIVQWCGTPQFLDRLYALTAEIRKAWGNIAAEYNEKDPDFPLRTLDCVIILAMLVAGELVHVSNDVMQKDCADIAEYFCRYVRLIQKQMDYTHASQTIKE